MFQGLVSEYIITPTRDQVKTLAVVLLNIYHAMVNNEPMTFDYFFSKTFYQDCKVMGTALLFPCLCILALFATCTCHWKVKDFEEEEEE